MNKDLFKTEITVKENKIGVMKVGNINNENSSQL